MRKVTLFTISLLTALGLLLTACATPTPEVVTVTVIEKEKGETVVKEVVVTATPEPVEREEAPEVFEGLPRDETLIVNQLTGRVGSPNNFNYWVGWKWRDRGMQNLAGAALWTIDFATGEIINSLAAGDAIYNDDFTRVEIPLREGVTWSDGEPFTSADVAFTAEMLMEYEGFNAHAFFSENVESVSTPDDYTVVFELKQPNSRFHTTFLDRWGCTWIMPKHIFETVEDPITFQFDPFVGTGPYKLHSYDPSGYWTIWEKREDWDKSPTGILYGEPAPKYIVFQAFANEGAMILAQLTHELDAADLSAEGLKAVLAQGETVRAYQPSFPWVVNNDPAMTGITFNTAVEPFDNPEVRWALLLSIDIAEYVGQAVDGMGTLSPVHIPSLGSYPENFIEPMIPWLSEFELDLGDGETFKPFDPEAPARVAEYARSRGYTFPDDPDYIKQAFGLGWYKYAPEAAEKLLIKNGFSRDENGNWLLPDGTPWKIEVIDMTDMTHLQVKNAQAAVQQWKEFGIDAVFMPTDAHATLQDMGDFQVSGAWPASEPWGAGVDLHKTLDVFNSNYVRPVGEDTSGHASRWSSPEMDEVLTALRETDPADTEAIRELGIEGLKLLIEDMPTIPTFGYIGFISWDEYYWTNWPGAENAYMQPYVHWGAFRYTTPFLEPVGP
ncbi:MAG: ABC transporter substrate-binding protein [Anaerolineae bacterium]